MFSPHAQGPLNSDVKQTSPHSLQVSVQLHPGEHTSLPSPAGQHLPV